MKRFNKSRRKVRRMRDSSPFFDESHCIFLMLIFDGLFISQSALLHSHVSIHILVWSRLKSKKLRLQYLIAELLERKDPSLLVERSVFLFPILSALSEQLAVLWLPFVVVSESFHFYLQGVQFPLLGIEEMLREVDVLLALFHQHSHLFLRNWLWNVHFRIHLEKEENCQVSYDTTFNNSNGRTNDLLFGSVLLRVEGERVGRDAVKTLNSQIIIRNI